jgi:4'-phosphopantetheinyl transferase EntD
VIAQILPAEVASAEAYEDPPGVELFAAEEAVIARAVDKRRREFGTVRHCARRALAELGLPPAPLLPGERGAPQWPAGVVGSMTHCSGYRAAAVARACQAHALGIDAEPHGPLPDGVLDAIARPEERSRLAALAAAGTVHGDTVHGDTVHGDTVHWDRLRFCAKEAVYKAWYPLTGRWLGFEDASVTIDPAGHTFSARLLVPGPTITGSQLAGFTGRWLARDRLVLTTVVVPAAPGG